MLQELFISSIISKSGLVLREPRHACEEFSLVQSNSVIIRQSLVTFSCKLRVLDPVEIGLLIRDIDRSLVAKGVLNISYDEPLRVSIKHWPGWELVLLVIPSSKSD